MPTLAQLGDLPTLLPDSLLLNSHILNREIKTIKPLDLAVFLRLHKGTSDYLRAVRDVEALKNFVMRSCIDGKLNQDDLGLLEHEMPREVFTSGELVEWLEQTSLSRRRAILFCLEMEMDPREVIELQWSDLRKMDLSILAHELVKASVRHIRLPYVFWDTLPNGAAAPLFGLAETCLEVSQGMGIKAMRKLYANMVMFDDGAEMAAFALDMH